MNEKEIMAKFKPRVLDNQVEFDAFMNALNNEQTLLNHPLLDKKRELAKERLEIEGQILNLHMRLNIIRTSVLDVEQEMKNINRVFHQLKHELITLNPKTNQL